MIIIWIIIGMWLGVVTTWAIVVSMSEPVARNIPDDVGPIDLLCWKSLYLVCDGLMDRRPRRWGIKTAWPRRGANFEVKPGHMLRAGWVVDRFYRDIQIDSHELAGGDPAGKFEAAARELLGQLLLHQIGGFAEQRLPPGLDRAWRACDPVTGVLLRVLHGYDIRENIFITMMDILAEVKVDIPDEADGPIIDGDKR